MLERLATTCILLMISLGALTIRPVYADRIMVAVTMPQLKSVVQEIGGEKISVECIIPAGADPHSYEPSEQILTKILSNASLIVMSGPTHLLIEKKIWELHNRGVLKSPIIDYRDYVREGLRILKNAKTGTPNPHGYMFSLMGLEAIAKAVTKKLVEIDPENREYYEVNLNRYLTKLSSIRDEIRRLGVQGVRVVLLGPPMQYVAEDLDLKIVDWILPELSIEVTEGDVLRIEDEIRSGEADLVFVSDLELSRQGKFLGLLKEHRIPYVVVPVLSLSDDPHMIPLLAATSIKYGSGLMVGSSGEGGLWRSMLIPSITANIILALLVALLLLKVRSYARER
ncbi:MAG: zinc ABC transporter substrate-binding protein [Thaumarchaeota archaeon]|nr:zinc ABC transporter substrate-binding protein [Nitrososphaerota archaeon]